MSCCSCAQLWRDGAQGREGARRDLRTPIKRLGHRDVERHCGGRARIALRHAVGKAQLAAARIRIAILKPAREAANIAAGWLTAHQDKAAIALGDVHVIGQDVQHLRPARAHRKHIFNGLVFVGAGEGCHDEVGLLHHNHSIVSPKPYFVALLSSPLLPPRSARHQKNHKFSPRFKISLVSIGDIGGFGAKILLIEAEIRRCVSLILANLRPECANRGCLESINRLKPNPFPTQGTRTIRWHQTRLSDFHAVRQSPVAAPLIAQAIGSATDFASLLSLHGPFK